MAKVVRPNVAAKTARTAVLPQMTWPRGRREPVGADGIVGCMPVSIGPGGAPLERDFIGQFYGVMNFTCHTP